MSLTRNLYVMDEVISALQTCLRSNNGRALFWFWELVVSLESQAAKEAAITAWLLWGGGNDPALLTLPPPTTIATTYPLMIRIQNAIQAAGSLNAHRFLTEAAGLSEPPPLPTTITPTSDPTPVMPPNDDDPDYAPPIWTGLQAAINAKSRKVAAWYLQSAAATLCADTVWLFLTALTPSTDPLLKMAIRLLQKTATPHTDSQLLAQMNAVFLLCNPTAALPPPTATTIKPTAMAIRDWDTWTATTGRRAARVHAIPTAALHSGTTRGSLSAAYTNVGEVRDPVPALLQSSCQFWRSTLAAAGATYDPTTDAACFPDDDALEAFYSTYFADDIPDEWSLVDQHKSHDQGCAESAPRAPLPLPLLDLTSGLTSTLAGLSMSDD
jgi:hypothetical protein